MLICAIYNSSSISGDNIYDIQATLNSITGTKASITLKTLSEAMTVGNNSSTGNSNNTQITSTTTSETGSGAVDGAEKSNKLIWIILSVVLVLIVLIIAYYIFRERY